MDGDFWTSLAGMAFVLVILALITVVIVVVIRQIFGVAHTAIATENAQSAEESYRKLAEEVAASQAEMAEQLTAISASMEDVKTRVASMERMMREVD